ncbi:MSMEG_0570 family nitrogen starvation response protein [Nocardioides flavescens]|nr:MSMEG_0570 family nitrogen starvation response protein [Nocardioides flavescens]
MTVDVCWPDGRTESLYSPSLVVHDHLVPGRAYSVRDFTRRTTLALETASERVRERYGFACTSAQATIEQVTTSAAAYDADEVVLVTRMWPPLPAETTQQEASA